ncbi:trypsin-7-like [Anoplophora glabripennis]|uniref:trypsin-7-like n=1 Tax=Anoplophora glabripennis TaxID=217634 RepID=UPI0008736E2E|nr:trypsin-7-like [Anoplophora glabripennis]
MKSLFVIFVVAAAVLGAPSEDVDGRIAGGYDVDIANYPYMLQLEYMDELVCGAILVTPNYALTSAQCLRSRYAEYFLVRAGSATLYEGGQELLIQNIVYHPQFEVSNNNYDVALMLLSGSVSNANPISLATNDDAIVEGASLTVAGWGWEEFVYYTEFSTNLKVVEIPILGNEACSSAYDIVSDVMFCAAYLEATGRGFCFGDNGGPGVINGVLVGVISFGQGCGDGTHAGVLIRVSKVRDWIYNIIGTVDV